MRFSYAEAMTDPSFYVPLAQAAEAAGYHSMTIADSLAYPYESDSKYPYTPDGNREFLDGKEIIETFVLTAALGAVTKTLRFNFFVLKLPVRPPALVAKQAGSLAALIGNRVGLGVGTSPWPEDYELMGVPFAKRGKRIDECIEIVKGLTTGEYFEFHGEFYDIPKTKMSPAPTAPIPILVGGHADAALRRAARLDGWMHGGGTDPDELDRLISKLQHFREEEGHTRPVRNPCDLNGCLHRRRHQAAAGQRSHRRHRGLPDALHQGSRHRAATDQDRPPGKVRREDYLESLDATANPMPADVSPDARGRPRPGCW
ncbi:LLM class flavin-dependent oxidoreductase [Mycobacterium ulcerans]|uniref:LLM class flavin-dependent oxidoreductase n=1 Tax=Mycobacterium ulcerans TaxID=1809 RepID=UPI000BA21165|nr:LLM class flavin-dependent oxidoreductase [Mycobacterium ulcerans]MEB3904790.1 LLM class flavin-dependent oxidoreductase [Mycobacterium ulcerans]MEB3908985.1 LLM class flavin-dependent oxidoreductase [Mycobacterium ulcerans]MEB3919184.1 LLM class flavin-dependent oxidoreductase [Mycobacterium ulcerans]MEB3923307.1 LLM class flavin-dependent oxidoreductase [Mycobacterium ulcerans]MEB3927511.1 LLM class flavin-dependent oxidoreductase [Mycobacterium ulcerans]